MSTTTNHEGLVMMVTLPLENVIVTNFSELAIDSSFRYGRK